MAPLSQRSKGTINVPSNFSWILKPSQKITSVWSSDSEKIFFLKFQDTPHVYTHFDKLTQRILFDFFCSDQRSTWIEIWPAPGNQNFLSGRFPVLIGTQNFFLAGPRYASVRTIFYLTSTWYSLVPKILPTPSSDTSFCKNFLNFLNSPIVKIRKSVSIWILFILLKKLFALKYFGNKSILAYKLLNLHNILKNYL